MDGHGATEKGARADLSAAQARSGGLATIAVPRRPGRRQRAAVPWRHERMEAEMSSVDVSSETRSTSRAGEEPLR